MRTVPSTPEVPVRAPLPDPEEVKRLLGLVPLPVEGGWYAETWRAGGTPRAWASAIYYLLDPGTFSALHRLGADEVWHFYLGDPVEILLLEPDGAARALRLGSDLLAGERPQAVVPGGTWQGARLVEGGRWALLGTTVSPAYEPGDFTLGRRAELVAAWPQERTRIEALTREP